MVEEAQEVEQTDAERKALWNSIADGKALDAEEKARPKGNGNGKDAAPEASEDEEPEESEEEDTAESDDEEGTEDEKEDEPADPWQSVPEELRKEHETLLEKFKKYEHENRSNRARVAALQRKVDDLSSKEKANPKDAEPPSKPDFDLDALFDEDWKRFEEDFSDVAKPIKAAISRSVSELRQEIEKAKKLSESLSDSMQQQQKHSELQRLNQEAPDWFSVIQENAEEFQFFLDDPDSKSPVRKLRKAIADTNNTEIKDADDVVWLVNEFKTHLASKNPAPSSQNSEERRKPESKSAPLPPKRKDQLKSAASVPPRSHPAPGRRSDDLPDPDDPKEQMFDRFAELLKKKAEAR